MQYAIDEFSPICLTLYGKARLHSEELEIKEDFIVRISWTFILFEVFKLIQKTK